MTLQPALPCMCSCDSEFIQIRLCSTDAPSARSSGEAREQEGRGLLRLHMPWVIITPLALPLTVLHAHAARRHKGIARVA